MYRDLSWLTMIYWVWFLSNKLSVFFRGALGINNKTLKFFSVLWKTKCMVHDALYKNCEIYCALVRGSGVKPVWLFSEIALNLNKYSSLLLYIFEKKTKYMVMMSVKPYTEIVKFVTPWSGVWALGRDLIKWKCMEFEIWIWKFSV